MTCQTRVESSYGVGGWEIFILFTISYRILAAMLQEIQNNEISLRNILSLPSMELSPNPITNEALGLAILPALELRLQKLAILDSMAS